ncbi:DEAD/DEAH box helicase [Nocardia stercoris]|uniref:DEAD/DEAH box helicase n=1 Tax=Nocardia stercoris TaxID=2483361 RepID=A0A3M2L2B2_9NOCA|nr:DEAD/DEAH box helicase [Nocardia stercoris]RMI31681.1 DEAD/DEAH box helicase [Nocardia stercoris]
MLHGLWSPGSGLLLWRPDGVAQPEGPGPAHSHDVLDAVLAAAKFRHRARVLLPGEPDPVQVPAHALAPPTAARLLLAELPPHRAGADLRFLGHVAKGVDRWVRAGRVVPELRRADGEWWVRWRLIGGRRQRAWQAELANLMPPALRAAGTATAVLDDLIAELADPITREALGTQSPGTATGFTAATGARQAHPLVTALLDDTPLDSGSHRVAAALEAWRTSLTAGEPELVLRLSEPDPEDPAGGDTDPDLPVLWRLQVCMRSEGEAPQPVSASTDATSIRSAGTRVAVALQAYPRLQQVPRDPDGMDFLLPAEVVQDLVAHGAHALRAAGVQLMLPRGWRILTPTMRLQVTSPAATETAVGLDGLVSYRWELALGDTVLTKAEMDRLVRAKSDLVRLRGEWVQADQRALAAAAAYLDERTDETLGSLGRALGELGAAAVARVPIEEITATGWAAELLAAGREAPAVPAPAGLRADLRPYQQRGLDWLATMSRLGCGAVLADDMGLGKTVQILALLVHERERTAAVGPSLLVCPMSVVGNWQREAQRFAPGLRVLVHHGPKRISGAEFDAAVADSDLVLTTYALLARDVDDHKRQPWQRVVLDEAQHIKNAATRQARAARAIPARQRVALTGTPVENRLEELRSIMDFAVPKLLGKPSEFHSRFAVPIEREHDPNAVGRLKALTGPFVLRRVKTDPAVISDLPDKIELTVRANLTVEQAALYQAVVDDMLAQLRQAKQNPSDMARRGVVLGALTRLKQVCNHPAHYLGDGSAVLRRAQHRSGKLALVEDILESVLADGEKALLFTQFREFGDLIAPYLDERFGTRVPFLHGGVAKRGRDAMVEEFQSGDGPPLMLLSLKAGGTGLNLTAANHVVHLDRWWNPAVENQATDRAFRIGQRRDVQVRKLVCVDTVEERIDEMISGKQELANLTVGTGERWITELSTDELRDLFALGAEAVGE